MKGPKVKGKFGPLPSIPRNAMITLSQFCTLHDGLETRESAIAKPLLCWFFHHHLSPIFTEVPFHPTPPPSTTEQAYLTAAA